MKQSIITLSVLFILSLFSSFSLGKDENIQSCPDNTICFYSEPNFTGTIWKWNSKMNYRDLPRTLHNNVGSIVSNSDGCLINWIPHKTMNVSAGEKHSDDFSFGKIIDGVSREC